MGGGSSSAADPSDMEQANPADAYVHKLIRKLQDMEQRGQDSSTHKPGQHHQSHTSKWHPTARSSTSTTRSSTSDQTINQQHCESIAVSSSPEDVTNEIVVLRLVLACVRRCQPIAKASTQVDARDFTPAGFALQPEHPTCAQTGRSCISLWHIAVDSNTSSWVLGLGMFTVFC